MKHKNEKYFIPSIADLQKIQYHENGEPLVSLEERCPEILCDYRRKDSGLSRVMVRKSIVNKLKKVQERLTTYDSKIRLLVVEGYRNPVYQERYFLEQLHVQYKQKPALDLDHLIEHVHQFVALPSVAGHPTGGAIDLTISYEGNEIDMGGAIADFSVPEKLPTHSLAITPEQTKNRMLLHDLMISERFAPPFYGEWWHFSYGDLEWAAFYGMTKTLYSNFYSGD